MSLGNFSDIMRKAQSLGRDLKEKQEELAKKTFEVSVGGDMVRMTFNGRGEAISVTLDPQAVDPRDVPMLEDLVLSAINQGVRRAQQLNQEEMSKLTGGLNIPGLTP